jgi:signal transduction histidine kinase
MIGSLTLKSTRRLQLVILAMLVTCVAQLIYWLWDEANFTNNVLKGQLEQLDRDARAGQLLLDVGTPIEVVQDRFPGLTLDAGIARIDQDQLEKLVDSRRRRLIRYGSEGTFLLLVLVGGIATISYTLRQPAQLMRRQENFVAAVSHEFKTPLASIKLAAETLLLREMDLDSQRRLADRVVQDTERLEAMVTNILDAGRIEEGQLSLRPETLKIEDMVRTLTDEVGCRAHVLGVQITPEVESGLAVHCDRVALYTALNNVLNNAVKSVALKGGGSVHLTAQTESDQVRIDIEDNGVGFEPSQASLLFEKFYRPGDELRRESSGSGLGLYIVKTFIEASGGRVLAKSDGAGHGATITCWLPRARGGPA